MPYSVDKALQDNYTADVGIPYSVDKALQNTLPMSVCPTRLTRRYRTNTADVSIPHSVD